MVGTHFSLCQAYEHLTEIIRDPLKEEFSLNQKLWDQLDYREKVNKSDTM